MRLWGSVTGDVGMGCLVVVMLLLVGICAAVP